MPLLTVRAPGTKRLSGRRRRPPVAAAVRTAQCASLRARRGRAVGCPLRETVGARRASRAAGATPCHRAYIRACIAPPDAPCDRDYKAFLESMDSLVNEGWFSYIVHRVLCRREYCTPINITTFDPIFIRHISMLSDNIAAAVVRTSHISEQIVGLTAFALFAVCLGETR